MSALPAARTLRLQGIARRWPRVAWDYRGLSRWSSFDDSHWTAVLTVGLLFSTAHFDILLWAPGALPLPLIGELGGSPEGCALLAVLVLFNGWVLDRLLAARQPAGLREVFWIRWPRAILAAAPLLGLVVIPLWQRLAQARPAWMFAPRQKAVLDLERHPPAGFGAAGLRTRLDTWLRAWSQRLPLQMAWVVGCQIAPWFSVLYVLGRGRSRTAIVVWVLLHLAAAGAGLAHTAVRSTLFQMTPGRRRAFRLLPLALLLPMPLSFLPLLLWLPASEDVHEDKGVLQTLYRARVARRHPLAATRRPRQDEIRGETADRRRLAEAGKLVLLFIESAALSRLATVLGFDVIPVQAVPIGFSGYLLVLLPALPGAVLLLAGAAGRIWDRLPRLAALSNHPAGTSLTLAPTALVCGALSGALAAPQDAGVLGLLLMVSAFLGALLVFLAAIWSSLLSLFFGRPERSFTGRIFALLLLVVLAALSFILARPPVFLAIVTVGALASPLLGIAIAACWLAPFRLRDLTDQRLPAPLRARLRALALTAILPLGGLALPWWAAWRRRQGAELGRCAARLLEPAE